MEDLLLRNQMQTQESGRISLCVCITGLSNISFIYTNRNITEKVGVLPIWNVKSNVSSVGPSSGRNWFPSDE